MKLPVNIGCEISFAQSPVTIDTVSAIRGCLHLGCTTRILKPDTFQCLHLYSKRILKLSTAVLKQNFLRLLQRLTNKLVTRLSIA